MRIVKKIWSGFSSWWTFALLILLSVAGFIYVNSEYNRMEAVFGTSARNVGTQMMTALTAGILFLWFIMNCHFTLKTKGIGLIFIALVGIGAASSIRRIGFNGNNVPVVEFAWTPTPEQRLVEAGIIVPEDDAKPAAVSLDPAILVGSACPSFLGPNHDGYVQACRFIPTEDSAPPKEKWRHPIGGGYAAFAVEGDLAVTIEQRGPKEVVSAYKVSTGEPLWTLGYPALFTEAMGGDGPRATPTIAGNHVFALGATGELHCIEVLTGKAVWHVNILNDAEIKNITWGMSGSPLVTDKLVIVNPGGDDKHDRGVIAYDRETGKVVWAKGKHPAAYVSPTLVTIEGVPQVILQSADMLTGQDLATGEELWKTPFAPMNGIAVGQPLLLPENHVFVSASYGAGSKLVKITKDDDKWKVEPVWDNQFLRCKFSSPIYVDGYIYGLDDGILACLDAKTGKRKWKGGRYGHGQMLYSDNRLFIQAEDGNFVIVATDPKKHQELLKWQSLPGIKNWNAPTLAGNRLLVRNHFEMAAYELPCSDNAPDSVEVTPSS